MTTSLNIAYLGDFSKPWSTECVVANALDAAGHNVLRMNGSYSSKTAPMIVLQRMTAHPDKPWVFLFVKGLLSDAVFPSGEEKLAKMLDYLRERGVIVVCWIWDLLAEEFSFMRYRWAKAISQACDIFFTTDGYTAPKLPNSVVLRQAYEGSIKPTNVGPSRLIPSSPPPSNLLNPTRSAIYLGAVYGERKAWIDSLRRDIAGFQSFANVRGPSDLASLYSSARIALGPLWPYYPGYWSTRIYSVTGYGGCFACPRVEGMSEDGWVPGLNYLALPQDMPDAVWELKRLLTMEPAHLQRVREEGHRLTMVRHTYAHRIRVLTDTIWDHLRWKSSQAKKKEQEVV